MLKRDSDLEENYDIKIIKDYHCSICLNADAANETTIPLLSGNSIDDIADYLQVNHEMHLTPAEISLHKRSHIKVSEIDRTLVDEFERTAQEVKEQASITPEHEDIISSVLNKLGNELEIMAKHGQYKSDEYLKLIKEYRSWLELRAAKPTMRVEFTASDLLKKLVIEEAEIKEPDFVKE